MVAFSFKVYLLSSVLLIAGIIHLIYPNVFLSAMPPYIPFHLPIIYLTGVLEIFASLGLLVKRTQKFTSVLIALYFLAILPAHFHVSLNKISMFGISNPIFLWGRTIFQAVFIYWAWSIHRDKD